MFWGAALALLSGGQLVAAAIVPTLTPVNFTEALTQHSLLLVNFYAPWCGHCRSLEAELGLAARDLVARKIPAGLAMVDATIPENEALAGEQGIDGFPSLILYRDGKRNSDYLGGRARRDLVEYLRRKSGPPAEPITTLKEIEDRLQELVSTGPENGGGGVGGMTALALGLFPPAPKESGRGAFGKAAQMFLSAAASYDYCKFLVADNLDLVRHYNVTSDTLVVFTLGDGGQEGIVPLHEGMDADNIIYALLTYSIPPIIDYDARTQPYLRSLLIKAHVLLFFDDAKPSSTFLATVADIASQFRGRLVFIRIHSQQHQLMQTFGLQPKDLPEMVVADMRDPLSMRRFGLTDFLFRREVMRAAPGQSHALPPLPHPRPHQQQQQQQQGQGQAEMPPPTAKDLSPETLVVFLSEFLADSLPRSVFSENAGEVERQVQASRSKLKQHGRPWDVVTAVGSTFNTHVMGNDGIDVLVYFFVPWCAHCKSFEPVFVELAAQARGNFGGQIRFVRIDGSKNEIDHPAVRLRGFPSVFLFRASDKLNPIEYDGDRTVAAFLAFIRAFKGGNHRGEGLEAEVGADGRTTRE